MLAVPATDEGGMRRAKTNKWIEVFTAPSQRPEFEGQDRTWWCCTLCGMEAKEISAKGDVYSAYQSHIVHAHDPADMHDKDGTAEQTHAMMLFPEGTKKARAKRAEKAAAKEARGAAAPAPALLPLPQAPAPLPLTYDAAVDALVAAGFKATGQELAKLATDVKERLGEPTAPPAKKPRSLHGSLSREMASLGGPSSQGPLEPRGDAIAREHARAVAGGSARRRG